SYECGSVTERMLMRRPSACPVKAQVSDGVLLDVRVRTINNKLQQPAHPKRLGFLSPIEFEEQHYTNRATTELANLNTRQPVLTS
ncbi:hypothetical protein, partial [Streptomyces sp. H39-C1]|uniref:hypothetical protein n=1 Tax=Streptomyces sp. H39-C1 TaxID=3004355 RepID=UPI0022B040B1